MEFMDPALMHIALGTELYQEVEEERDDDTPALQFWGKDPVTFVATETQKDDIGRGVSTRDQHPLPEVNDGT